MKDGERKLDISIDGISDIEFQDEIPIKSTEDPLCSIVTFTYLDMLRDLTDSRYFTNRVILALRMDIVDEINDFISSMVTGDFVEYTHLWLLGIPLNILQLRLNKQNIYRQKMLWKNCMTQNSSTP